VSDPIPDDINSDMEVTVWWQSSMRPCLCDEFTGGVDLPTVRVPW
jgi:hypothetical protein